MSGGAIIHEVMGHP
jgi:hypothetical protein